MSIDGKAAQEVLQIALDHAAPLLHFPDGSTRGEAFDAIKAWVSGEHFPAQFDVGVKATEIAVHAAQGGPKPTAHDLISLAMKAIGG